MFERNSNLRNGIRFEADVALYLTIDGHIFIALLFNIEWEMNEAHRTGGARNKDFHKRNSFEILVPGALHHA